MERFEIELKWATYFAIVNLIVMSSLCLLALVFPLSILENHQNSIEVHQDSVFVIKCLVGIYLVQLFYFTRKAIKEYKKHTIISLYYQLDILLWVFSVSLVLQFLVSPMGHSNLYFENIKRNLSEFLIEEES